MNAPVVAIVSCGGDGDDVGAIVAQKPNWRYLFPFVGCRISSTQTTSKRGSLPADCRANNSENLNV